MSAKLQALYSSIKLMITNVYDSVEPGIMWIIEALTTIASYMSRISGTITLVLGIVIGYKIEPVLKFIMPFLRIILDIIGIPFRILGWL